MLSVFPQLASNHYVSAFWPFIMLFYILHMYCICNVLHHINVAIISRFRCNRGLKHMFLLEEKRILLCPLSVCCFGFGM